MKKLVALILILTFGLVAFAACSKGGEFGVPDAFPMAPGWNGSYTESVNGNYNYNEVVENGFTGTSESNVSYFSLDRNTAAYSLMRRQINSGLTIAANSVRLEEYVNYFAYDYARPESGNALALSGNIFDCPWNAQHKLFSIGVAAEEISFEDCPQSNVVFLIDTSGSMYGADRLGLIQQSFTMLLESIPDDAYVSIVTYAGDSRIALDGARGNEKTLIANVLQDLTAQGSTNGAGGIQKAYALAEKYFVQGGNNRVILATDGDFNVGVSDQNGLKNLITEKRDSGIYLSVLGVGMYNTQDSKMETLANNGNGNYAYLDSVSEARRVLVDELGGTFNVVAKDAKIGVEFNDEVVESFRLIGYENKMMSEEEFNDEQKDAGEIGSGHTVTAVYEIVLKDGATGNVATAEVRFKDPKTNESKSVARTYATDDYVETPSEDNVFLGCVVEYGLLLRNSEYKGDATIAAVTARLQQLESVVGAHCDAFRAEFLTLVQKAALLYDKAGSAN